jgi:conserved domain protein
VVEIEFLGPIGLESIKVEAKNLGEVKAALSEKEELKKWLNICAVAVNDEIVKRYKFRSKNG